jgi:hypothetical protein
MRDFITQSYVMKFAAVLMATTAVSAASLQLARCKEFGMARFLHPVQVDSAGRMTGGDGFDPDLQKSRERSVKGKFWKIASKPVTS